MDLIIRKARLREKEELLDIGIQGGKITAIEKKISGKAKEEVDAKGRLTTPAFCDPHIHPDKSFLRDKLEPMMKVGGAEEALRLTNVLKKDYTMEDILERAGRVMELAARHGSTTVRAFADIDNIGGLLPFKSLLKLKEDYKDIVEIQVVAFPQEGIVKNPGSEELMKEAMELGPDLVGSPPWNEMTDEDSKYQTDLIFDLARQYNKDIHLLEDTVADAYSRGIEHTAGKVIREKFPHIVTVSHLSSLQLFDDAHATKVINLIKEAGINVCPNAHLVRTRVQQLFDAGINVCAGQDDVCDPWHAFGKMDQLEVAFLTAHTCRMELPHQLEKLFDMITYNAAKAMGINDYGLAIGCRADIVIHEAENVRETLRMRLERPYVIKGGRIIAKNGVVRRYKLNQDAKL